jgi:dTDP-4-amino-4,6-dideoxygalactose transaminase
MCALLCRVEPGDEVIVPSYTFVSTALAFVRQGCKIVFADSMESNPNIDAEKIEALITPRTKVIVPVHYAGVACDMDKIMDIAKRHNLLVVEDAAQAIDSYYKGRPLGTIGHLSAFSFHETKNIISGEGGLLGINDERFVSRAEILWEKGTNRSEFFRGEVNKYGWKDTGSSFLPSEVISAFLWAQLECMDDIQAKRKKLWEQYFAGLQILAGKGFIRLPQIPGYATNNAHMFYVVCRSMEERTELIKYLKGQDVLPVFHYMSLHKSDYYRSHSTEIPDLPLCDMYADCLVRFPMYYELTLEDVDRIVKGVYDFYMNV